MQALLRRHDKALALIILSALGFLVYANALTNGFHFDDYEGILQNESLRDLRNIPAFFTDPLIFRLTRKLDWRPILQISYAVDYAIGGYNPAVFHATDVLFHIVSAWLIFLIVGEIVKQSTPPPSPPIAPAWIALVPAMLFVVHTVNTQTVNYPWARSSLLAGLFYLLAFYCHLRGPFHRDGHGNHYWHAGALVAYACGLGSKATAVSFPGMLIAYEALLLNPNGRNPLTLYIKEPRRLVKHLPTFAVLVGYMALRTQLTPQITGRFVSDSWISRKTYLLTQFRAWVYYLKLYVWPDPLIFDYQGFDFSRSLADPRVLAAAALVVLIVAAGWSIRKHNPLLTFFTAWFFIALLPEASIIVRPDAITGHRPYLAYAGLSVAAVLVVLYAGHALVKKWSSSLWITRLPTACGVLFAVAALALTAATVRRNRIWRDDVTLWSDVVAKDPENARAYLALGVQYLDRSEYAQARTMLDKAVALDPNRQEPYLHRGYLNLMIGNYDDALNDLQRSMNGRRPSAFSLVYRGDVYREMGRYDEALRDYRLALQLNKNFTEAYYGAALAYWKNNDLAAAAAACRKLMQLEPENRRSYLCLGSLLMHQQLFAEAQNVYSTGVSRFPENATLWYGLGTAFEELHRYKEAEEAYAKSSSLAKADSATK
jgi:tetratricopeptide (TPR) repeat protein